MKTKALTVLALCVAALVLVPASPALAVPILNDGFESGNFSAWSANSGMTIQSTNVHSGTFAANGTANSSVTRNFTAQSTVYSEVWFYRDASSTLVRLLRYRSNGGAGSVARVYISTNGMLAFRNDFTGVQTNTSVVLPLDSWHRVEFRATIVAGTSDTVGVWLDGAAVAGIGTTQNLGDLNVDQLVVLNDATGTYDIDIDDACIDTVRLDGVCGTPPPTAPVIATAGDICGLSASAELHCMEVANLIVANDPDAVLPTGDTQYESGTAAEYANPGGYRDAWGIDNSPSFFNITYPAVGNHEYNDPANGLGAEGYRAEFAARGLFGDGNLYYTHDIGNWHLVALDTDDPSSAQCFDSAEDQPGIRAGCAQTTWFSNDLANDDHTCDLVYGHHPRYSSSNGGGSLSYMDAAWDTATAADVDIWIASHDHGYERFAQLEGGTRLFVVGTGGQGLNGFNAPVAGSQVRIGSGQDAWGALFVTLDEDSYSWEFKDRQGDVRDSGGPISCH